MVNVNINPMQIKRGKRKAPTSYGRVAAAKKSAGARAGYTAMARQLVSPGEMKYFDTELSAATLVVSTDWTGTEFDPDTVPVANIDCLFAPKIGSAINQRIARQVKVHKIKVRGAIIVGEQVAQTTGDGACYLRLVLVMDKQTNALQMQGEQCFTDPVTATGNMAMLSYQSLANLGRFQVLKDLKILIQNPNMGNSTAVTNNVSQGLVNKFQFNINFPDPCIVHFNSSTGGTVTSIVDNSFHILACCNNVDLVPTLTYYSRVSYKE